MVHANDQQEQLLQKVKDKINNYDTKSYDLLKKYFDNEMFYTAKSKKLNKTSLAQALYLYGRLTFFGLKPKGENSLKLAYFFFKIAAEFGSPDAHFMIALFASYKLDGSFNIFTHFNDQDSLQTIDFLTQLQKQRLYQYAADKKFSQTLIHLYYSNLQGNLEATLSLGYRQSRGIGVDVNCSAASLYYDTICSNLLLGKQANQPKLVQKKRLDHDIYNIKQGIFEILFEHDKVQILENFKELDKKNLPDIVSLAYYYYYGLGGLQKDFNKSFELFNKINSDQVNHHIQYILGSMYMEGLGTPVAHYFFQKSSLFNNSDALNGLGYLYMNGLGVQEDKKKALQYFLKSAQNGNSDGQYNLGILHLMPSTPDLTRDKKVGHYYISLAAQQGHALAQYSLDGVDFYYSCELAVTLMKTAVQVGPWSEYLQNGYQFFIKNNFRTSFMNYLISAMLGDETGLVNAAIIADKYDIINEQDTNYYDIENSLIKDPVYQILSKNQIYRSPSPIYYLFGDYLQILQKAYGPEEQINILKRLLNHPQNSKRNINKYIAFKSYSLCVNDNAYSNMRLGDFYYYGIYDKQSYTEAYKYYKQASSFDINNSIIAQSYFNLAFMSAEGVGTKQNKTQSMIYYNKSLHLNPLTQQYAPFLLKSITFGYLVNLFEPSDVFHNLADYIIDLQNSNTLYNGLHGLVFTILSVTIIILIGYRKRILNEPTIFQNEQIDNM